METQMPDATANDRLIAAAPELLSACRSAVSLLEMLVSMEDIPANNDALRECKAALAKVEGH
jgi:hypothetical protein